MLAAGGWNWTLWWEIETAIMAALVMLWILRYLITHLK